jgi:hypothetical protein
MKAVVCRRPALDTAPAGIDRLTVHDMLILRDLGIRRISHDDATKISLNLVAFPRL